MGGRREGKISPSFSSNSVSAALYLPSFSAAATTCFRGGAKKKYRKTVAASLGPSSLFLTRRWRSTGTREKGREKPLKYSCPFPPLQFLFSLPLPAQYNVMRTYLRTAMPYWDQKQPSPPPPKPAAAAVFPPGGCTAHAIHMYVWRAAVAAAAAAVVVVVVVARNGNSGEPPSFHPSCLEPLISHPISLSCHTRLYFPIQHPTLCTHTVQSF